MELANLLCRACVALSTLFLAAYLYEVWVTLGSIKSNLNSINDELKYQYRSQDILEIVIKLDRIANAMENKGKDAE